MKLCIRLYLVVIFCHAEPLPSPNPGLVHNFKTILDVMLDTGLGMLARSTTMEHRLTKNVVFSPISSIVLTAELMLGKSEKLPASESDLHQQLGELLQLLESAPNATKHFRVKRQDAVFVNKNITLSRNYVKKLRNLYETPVHYVDFKEDPEGAQRDINSWASVNTQNHIRSVLPSPPPPATSSIFSSACYLQADWRTPFAYALNKSQFFNLNSTRKVPITYLFQQFNQIIYGESNDFLVAALPYTAEEVRMYIILPNHQSRYKYDLKAFISRISFDDVQETIANAQRHDLLVKIPKMSLSRSFSVREDLKENVGLKQENIDLEGAAVGGWLRVDDVMHQVVVDFDQKDVEYSNVDVLGSTLVGGVKNFFVNRPFLFFVRHEATTAMLFIGAVCDPRVV
ncbi:leukocyte elastase inhibitor-like [Zophobas morio]|uniref:leukocyte elastase inhibitor-like n=1 Tax=Zophobas morio TaxID=2755281 RepID=UPI0030830C84